MPVVGRPHRCQDTFARAMKASMNPRATSGARLRGGLGPATATAGSPEGGVEGPAVEGRGVAGWGAGDGDMGVLAFRGGGLEPIRRA
jgi:hypothetical protein